MAIKIPLKMSDGKTVRTIEELREHFNLAEVLGYYESGRLVKWLSDGYYDEEAENVKALDSSSEDLGKELCNILGVDYQEYDKVDLEDITNKNERLERLRQYTADDRILASVGSVAFTQEELDSLFEKADLLEKDDDGNTVIYLCGEQFTPPNFAPIGIRRDIIYKGVNNPTVTFPTYRMGSSIDLQDLEFDLDSYIFASSFYRFDDYYDAFYDLFMDNLLLGVKLLRMAVEKGSVEAQCALGKCYMWGEGVEENPEEAVRWYREAAEQGNAEAQYELGECYYLGEGVEENPEEAVRWYREAAEQGNAEAQYKLGDCYRWGEGVEENPEEAVRWYREAAEWYQELAEEDDEDEEAQEMLRQIAESISSLT